MLPDKEKNIRAPTSDIPSLSINLMTIFASTSHFKESHKNSHFFMCISPQFWCQEHQRFYSKKIYEDLLMESRNQQVYSHHFFKIIFTSTNPFFMNCANFSIFRVYQTMDLAYKHPKKFIKKHYEDLCIIFVTITYTHTYFFTSISSSTDLFRNHANFQFFMYINLWIQRREHPNMIFKKSL